jgi:hypothetical protein
LERGWTPRRPRHTRVSKSDEAVLIEDLLVSDWLSVHLASAFGWSKMVFSDAVRALIRSCPTF